MVSQMMVTPPPGGQDLYDLTRLLNRLENNLLTGDVDASLQRSVYHRRRMSANLDHAHNILLRLEHDTNAAKAKSQRDGIQANLQQKRVLLKRLQNQLYELEQLDGEDEDESSAEHEYEDLLSIYAPTGDQSHIDNSQGKQLEANVDTKQEEPSQVSQPHLRSRHNRPEKQEDKGETSGADVDERSRLFASTSSSNPTGSDPSTTTTEDALLQRHTAEQEALTTSLLEMATKLKTSTQSFSDTLSASNPLVDRATAALDRNVSGMEAAERRMGLLRRMTEGRGWWARLSLYAYIALLWVALILIMFLMPKLRF